MFNLDYDVIFVWKLLFLMIGFLLVFTPYMEKLPRPVRMMFSTFVALSSLTTSIHIETAIQNNSLPYYYDLFFIVVVSGFLIHFFDLFLKSIFVFDSPHQEVLSRTHLNDKELYGRTSK